MSINSDIIVKNIAKNIKEQRLEKGVSCLELSERTGIDLSHIYRIEKGTRKVGLDALLRISIALDISIMEVFKAPGVEELNELMETEVDTDFKKQQFIIQVVEFLSNCTDDELIEKMKKF